jgi:hypothetical protein
MHYGRKEALHMISNLTKAVRTLATASIQHRIHHEFASGNLTVKEMSDLQAEYNGVSDHLDAFMSRIDGMLYPENDWTGVNKKGSEE